MLNKKALRFAVVILLAAGGLSGLSQAQVGGFAPAPFVSGVALQPFPTIPTQPLRYQVFGYATEWEARNAKTSAEQGLQRAAISALRSDIFFTQNARLYGFWIDYLADQDFPGAAPRVVQNDTKYFPTLADANYNLNFAVATLQSQGNAIILKGGPFLQREYPYNYFYSLDYARARLAGTYRSGLQWFMPADARMNMEIMESNLRNQGYQILGRAVLLDPRTNRYSYEIYYRLNLPSWPQPPIINP